MSRKQKRNAMKNLKILHICVNYTNDRETENFVLKCLELDGAKELVQFVVVNNSASDKDDRTFIGLSACNPQPIIINAPMNPGYFGAADLVLKQVDIDSYKFVILSNSDLEILNQDFYRAMNEMKIAKDVGGLAPSIFSQATAAESNPLYRIRPSKVKMRMLAFVFKYYWSAWIYHFFALLKSGFIRRKHVFFDEEIIYAPHGCFLILSKAYFHAGGTFEYPVKLYGEEVFLAERFIALKLKVIMVNSLKVSHREKGTMVGGWFQRILPLKTWQFKKESSKFILSQF